MLGFKIPKVIISILLCIVGFSSYAQAIVVSGKVTDTIQNQLAYANILAIPESDTQEVRFAIGLYGLWFMAYEKNNYILLRFINFKLFFPN